MHVAPKSSAKMFRVNRGTYRLQFVLGHYWLGGAMRFCEGLA